MNEFSRLTGFYADDLHVQREQVARRAAQRPGTPHRRTTRNAIASGLHRLADRLDHDLA
jgi:hypothetical protein